jgi:hypothetical protein
MTSRKRLCASPWRRLDLFLGSENYDNRIDNGGMFDLEVLADLHRRYGDELDRPHPGPAAAIG